MTPNEMRAIIKKTAMKLTVLNLGCGNSPLSKKMYDHDSFKYTINIDISPVVINAKTQ